MTTPTPTEQAPETGLQQGRASGYSLQSKTTHGRTIVGLLLILIGVVFALPVGIGLLLRALHPPTVPLPGPSLLELIHELGFPVLLIGGGYNLLSPQGFEALADKIRSFLPGKS